VAQFRKLGEMWLGKQNRDLCHMLNLKPSALLISEAKEWQNIRISPTSGTALACINVCSFSVLWYEIWREWWLHYMCVWGLIWK